MGTCGTGVMSLWLPVFQGGCNVAMVTCVSGRGVMLLWSPVFQGGV